MFLIPILNEYLKNVRLHQSCFFFLQLVIPLTTQDDLDKAVELLDRSVHMKSLKILLVLQMSSQVRLQGNSVLILILRFELKIQRHDDDGKRCKVLRVFLVRFFSCFCRTLPPTWTSCRPTRSWITRDSGSLTRRVCWL